MAARISRERRAELSREAHQIRGQGQRAGWTAARIAAAIQAGVPQLLPLEAWRLAYGWTRPQVIAGIAALYASDGLAIPPLNASMLCRWEHGEFPPGPEYERMLARLYQARPADLGLGADRVFVPPQRARPGYGQGIQTPTAGSGYQMTADDSAAALAAVRESAELALEAEGPAGGPLATAHVDAAWQYYAARYSAYEPALLATEVHRTRALVTSMLRQAQPDTARTEVRRTGGWLSALAGNLAFHLGDFPAAQIHLSTAARLGTASGDARLTCWALGAQSMTARAQRRPAEALDLARQAAEYAATPLQHAQVLSWAELPALAALGPQHRSDALSVIAAAQDQVVADPDGEQPGRFGFDAAELHLHIAEATLVLGDAGQARDHALRSRAGTRPGRPSWAAATLVLARAEAARGQHSDAAALAHAVLDEIPAGSLRETSRSRLRALDSDLRAVATADRGPRDLTERVRALPPLIPVGRLSDEPNGTR